jgi:quercetin dioxygenase-like cupin family protein
MASTPAPLSPHVFGSITSEDVVYQPFAAFPSEARLAVLVGDPTKAGPYVVRVKAEAGARLMPHQHPEDRIYTVISGVFYIGLGGKFDPEQLTAYAPGTVIVLPGNTHHFHWAKSGEYITQVSGYGPLGIDYIDVKNDPRRGR